MSGSAIKQFLPEPEPRHDRQQDTITTRISRPLVNLVNKVEVLIPSGGIVLRASALAVVLVSAVGLALFSFFWLWTSVSVPDSQYENVWLQYGHSRAPYASLSLVGQAGQTSLNLVKNQDYNVLLELDVPGSRKNLDLGNFMVSLDLINYDGRTAYNVSRPASLPPTPLVRALLTLILPPPTHKIRVPLLSRARLSRQLARADVEVGRKDAHLGIAGWDGGKGELQVFAARLKFEAHLEGLRYVLRYHPFLGFLWFVPTFLVCELIAAGAMWLIYASRQSDTDDDGPDDLNRLRGRVKHEGGQVKLEPLESSDEAESTVSGLSEREGAGFRRGMTAVEGTETEEEEEEEGFSESASQAGEYGAEEAALAVKPEEGDDARTIGGSDTTRGTGASFGPSLASTSATATSRGTLRSRQSGGMGGMED